MKELEWIKPLCDHEINIFGVKVIVRENPDGTYKTEVQPPTESSPHGLDITELSDKQ